VTPFRGTWFVVPTPFDEDGALDLGSQRSVVEAAIGWSVDGLTVMGMTSEASSLSPGEREAALQAISAAVAGRVPVVVGCSGETTKEVCALARDAAARGASAAMVAAPPATVNLHLLPGFYAEVAAEGGLPVLVQDDPNATGVVVPVETLAACVDAAEATTVKLEDPPTPSKIAALLAARPGLDVFGGLGGVHALAELRVGACGTMSGFAFPEILEAIRASHERADADRAGHLFDRFLPLIAFEAQAGVGVAARKELLRRRGAIGTAVTRQPLRTLDAVLRAELDAVLARVGVDPGPDRLAID